MKCFVFLALFISSLAFGETITLTKQNTVSVRTVITGETIAPIMQQLLELDRSLPAGEPIYMFLDTPGGSIADGLDMIVLVKSLNRPVKTITKFAASMGFVTAQYLEERLILPNGIMMSHRAKGGVSGQIPGELDTRYEFFKSYLRLIDVPIAKRLNMSIEAFDKMNVNEYWVYGEDAITDTVADKIVNAKCDKTMQGAYTEKVNTFFGVITVKWSECPLISSPIEVTLEASRFNSLNEKDRDEANRLISIMFYDKMRFVDEYITTNKFKRYFP